MAKIIQFLICLFVLGASACDLDFAYSPYESTIDDDMRDLNRINIALLASKDTHTGRTFKFAFISDIHRDYAQLEQTVSRLNSREDIDFVVIGGDVADKGLKSEYIFFHGIIDELIVPYLVVVGNHDALCNGKEIFRKMFGDFNYSFVYERCKFIIFNSNALEFPGEAPDFSWLETEMSGAE